MNLLTLNVYCSKFAGAAVICDIATQKRDLFLVDHETHHNLLLNTRVAKHILLIRRNVRLITGINILYS